MKTLKKPYKAICIALAFAIVSCQTVKNEQETLEKNLSDIEAEQVLSQFAYSDEFIEFLSDETNFNKTKSPYLTRREAAFRIKLYKYYETARDGSFEPKKDIYGFTFPLQNFMDFADSIKAYNDLPDLPKDKVITGVRVYKSWRFLSDSLTEEVFMVPTIGESWSNLYQIDDDFKVNLSDFFHEIKNINFETDSVDLILDASIPCPNNCNGETK